jgi:hypothetical protein
MGIAKELAKPIFYGAAAFAAAEWQFDIAQDFINAVEPENDTEELAGAIFVLILGGPEAEEAVGGGGPAGKQPRFNGPKPRYAENPVHIPGRGLRPGKTPLPPDAEAVFSRAVPNAPSNPTAWFGKNSEGSIYRFSSSNDGSAHFSGIEGVGDGTRNLTPYAKDRLNGQ